MTHKYRAWDKKWNRWIEPKDICVYGDGTADFVRRAENGDKIEIVELKSGEIELEQYIGIKDRKRTKEFPKGQDICGGDIVSAGIYYDEGPRILEIYYDRGGYWIDYKGEGYDRVLVGEFMGSLEIIGNIHQNPELKEN